MHMFNTCTQMDKTDTHTYTQFQICKIHVTVAVYQLPNEMCKYWKTLLKEFQIYTYTYTCIYIHIHTHTWIISF